jgi:hypothetical protein
MAPTPGFPEATHVALSAIFELRASRVERLSGCRPALLSRSHIGVPQGRDSSVLAVSTRAGKFAAGAFAGLSILRLKCTNALFNCFS